MENTPRKQRLVIFLDGTWNTEDDSTNILQAHALTQEGLTEDGYIQKRYYDRGVGTGLLDSVVGGGFGVGLEVNVREAYNWLIDNYRDKSYYDEKDGGDEIYIFGFSRGAYSARSLVSFIATCGLLRRGAPLTNSQLWNGYVQISRQRGNKKSWWRKQVNPPFRRITTWLKPEEKNLTEKLLSKWSRRVEINYLGIFDTVGAMGLEALGISGIRSRSGLNHNQNPTSLILKCRHAMAIDENRSSFKLTKLLNYVSNVDKKKDTLYDDRIYHRWFVGAHSDIGGGYDNNLLAAYPLKWILDGAKEVGLKVEENKATILKPEEPEANISQVNDSYLDFAGIIWPHILREKRHYRKINQADIIVANKPQKKGDEKKYKYGFSLITINEEIDPSVIKLVESDKSNKYAPPNLINYVRRLRTLKEDTAVTKEQKEDIRIKNEKIIKLKSLFKERKVNEQWLGSKGTSRLILVLWSIFAAVGVTIFLNIFLFHVQNVKQLSVIGISALTTLFVVVDLAEFHLNLKTSLEDSAIVSKVLYNLMMWLRMSGIVFFIIGVIAFIYYFILQGRNPDFSLDKNIESIFNCFNYAMAMCAVLSVLIFDLSYNRAKTKLSNLLFTILAPSVLVLSGVIIYYVASFFTINTEDPTLLNQKSLTSGDILSGQLIIVEILLLLFYFGFLWVGKPSRKAGFKKSVVYLQFAFSRKINQLFEEWINNIVRIWNIVQDKEQNLAWNYTQNVLRESLWRDNVGFIPIYTFVFGITMWIGSVLGKLDNWTWLNESTIKNCFSNGDVLLNLSIPIWIFLIAITAIADYFENFIHLRFIKEYKEENQTFPLAPVASLASAIKFIGFIPSALFSFGIFVDLIIQTIFCVDDGGWRWILAHVTTLSIGILLILYIKFSLRKVFVKEE